MAWYLFSKVITIWHIWRIWDSICSVIWESWLSTLEQDIYSGEWILCLCLHPLKLPEGCQRVLFWLFVFACVRDWHLSQILLARLLQNVWTDQILVFKGQRSRSQDQIWAKIQFWSHNSIQVYQVGPFIDGKDLFLVVSSTSENLRSKCQNPSSPHDQIWAKLQFWIHNSIQIYQVSTFVKCKDFLGQR